MGQQLHRGGIADRLGIGRYLTDPVSFCGDGGQPGQSVGEPNVRTVVYVLKLRPRSLHSQLRWFFGNRDYLS